MIRLAKGKRIYKRSNQGMHDMCTRLHERSNGNSKVFSDPNASLAQPCAKRE
jgi:hypothetical protein